MLFGNRLLPKADLLEYALYFDSLSNIEALSGIKSEYLQVLRLSGRCVFPRNLQLTRLKHLIIHNVTGNSFDQHGICRTLGFKFLMSFVYVETQILGFEIQDQDLLDLTSQCANTLRSLVLLRCSHLTTPVVASCLQTLCGLQYLAISFAPALLVNSEVIYSIPAGVRTLKLSLSNKKSWQPVSDEERNACYLIGDHLSSYAHLKTFYLYLRPKLRMEGLPREWQIKLDCLIPSFLLSNWENQEMH